MDATEKYFDCLSCGLVSPIKQTPVKCPACNTGNGVINEGPLKPADQISRARIKNE